MKRNREESGEEGDVDQDFLDRVLNQLYDFGDGAKGKRSKKGHKKRKTGNDEEDTAVEEEASNDESSSINDKADLNDMKGANRDERIPTSTSSDSTSKSTTTSTVEIVTFQDPLKTKKLKKAVEPEVKPPEVKDKKKNDKKDPDDFLSIEKARLEVHRFGITGFQKEQQRVFEQDRAIMLGARPPKKDYVNYKVYQQMIKEKRLKEKEEAKQSETQGKKRKGGKPGKQKTEKRKSSSSGSEPTGQVGRFKNGMLVLSNKDIQKLKVKVRK
ncbi:uncharacterized protein C1orf131 homolog [Colossoma macropomum]|uniref:uncharacterized protein C1orf131 homolog n=1 Tax=Colossoma macropomum TaxID=42526 RepID=UPI00186511E9|nr:uncharacterized protein C1orf131 homolog [Colossoma macropomum]